MEDKKIYQMFLSSLSGFPSLVDNTNTLNLYYNIDWDAFFSREQYNYKNCRVKVRYVTNANTGYSYTYTGYVLVANFSGPYTNKIVPNTVLGLAEVYAGVNDGGTARGYLVVDTTQEMGTQINAPQGQQQFNLALWRDGYGAIGSGSYAIPTSPVHCTCILTFELYN